MVWWSRTEKKGEEEDITRKGEEMRRVHREQPFHYSQANRRNDIRVVPFVSFGTKQLYALLTISTAFRPLFSFSPLARSHLHSLFPPRHVFAFCLSFSATFSSSSLLSHLLLLLFFFFFFVFFFLLLTDSTIRQIARTNDEPRGELLFDALYYYTLLFPFSRIHLEELQLFQDFRSRLVYSWDKHQVIDTIHVPASFLFLDRTE